MIKYVIVLVLLIIMVAFIFVLLWSNVEGKKMDITKYKVTSKKLPLEFNDFKIMFLADMHNYFYSSERIINVCENEKPDIIILGGDMIVYNPKKTYDILSMARFINKLSKYAPIYYAPGNHEMGWDEKGDEKIWSKYMNEVLSSGKVTYLSNDFVDVKNENVTVKIYGLDLRDGYYKRVIKKKLTSEAMENMLGNLDKDDFSILIAHNPDYFKEYSDWGADVVFSGHNHGGLLRLPIIGGVLSPRLRPFPKYDRGIFWHKHSCMILTGGLGAHSVKIRVNNVPELVFVTLEKE